MRLLIIAILLTGCGSDGGGSDKPAVESDVLSGTKWLSSCAGDADGYYQIVYEYGSKLVQTIAQSTNKACLTPEVTYTVTTDYKVTENGDLYNLDLVDRKFEVKIHSEDFLEAQRESNDCMDWELDKKVDATECYRDLLETNYTVIEIRGKKMYRGKASGSETARPTEIDEEKRPLTKLEG